MFFSLTFFRRAFTFKIVPMLSKRLSRATASRAYRLMGGIVRLEGGLFADSCHRSTVQTQNPATVEQPKWGSAT